ncbi:unnamed protein product [Urochloa humidicola]
MASSSRRQRGERAAGNWEHLVRAALERGGRRPRAGGGGLGMAAAVPASLGRTTNIEHIPTSRGSFVNKPTPWLRILIPAARGEGCFSSKQAYNLSSSKKLANKDGAPMDRRSSPVELLSGIQEPTSG